MVFDTKNSSPKHQFEHGLFRCAFQQVDGAVVKVHDLARNAEADARTIWFGSEERNENLFLTFATDGFAVVTDHDTHLFVGIDTRFNVDLACLGLHCVLAVVVVLIFFIIIILLYIIFRLV